MTSSIESASKLLFSTSICIMKFQHAVVQNQLAELIFHFKKYDFIKEEELFNIIQEEIEVAINDTKPHADTLRKVLFAFTVIVGPNKTFLNVSA
jgi:siderophore synthetase component